MGDYPLKVLEDNPEEVAPQSPNFEHERDTGSETATIICGPSGRELTTTPVSASPEPDEPHLVQDGGSKRKRRYTNESSYPPSKRSTREGYTADPTDDKILEAILQMLRKLHEEQFKLYADLQHLQDGQLDIRAQQQDIYNLQSTVASLMKEVTQDLNKPIKKDREDVQTDGKQMKSESSGGPSSLL
ncbi:MAG: hypothetical protein M1823_003410 [Watsoniomyces obsoletus]|nr:MAG: hypothetical protein M1823_003410 [Watsoniomyces obsoletus]